MRMILSGAAGAQRVGQAAVEASAHNGTSLFSTLVFQRGDALNLFAFRFFSTEVERDVDIHEVVVLVCNPQPVVPGRDIKHDAAMLRTADRQRARYAEPIVDTVSIQQFRNGIARIETVSTI